MGVKIKSDTTGEELTPETSCGFRAELSLRVDPSGLETIRLETPLYTVRRTSRNIVDNAEYQDFLEALTVVAAAIEPAWEKFLAAYERQLKKE